jgi:hypothetical protein
MIGDLNEPFQVRSSICGADRAQVLYTRHGQVPITLIRQDSTRHTKQTPDEIRTVLAFFAKFVEIYRPDVLLTYGGDPITLSLIGHARRRGVPVVFGIHNFQYVDPRAFARVDYCIVASEFARRHYRDKFGLDCHALPYPVDWERVPSLWWETQGLVAVEAIINGIPVVASDRGALPETLGDGGIALPLPERLTPVSRILPTAEEVEPWIEAIIRLWDDRSCYQERSTRAKNEAERWHPDRLQPPYADFFGGVCVLGGGSCQTTPVESRPFARQNKNDNHGFH